MARNPVPHTLAEAQDANRQEARRRDRIDRVWSLLGTAAGIVVLSVIVGWMSLRCYPLGIHDAGQVTVAAWDDAPEVFRSKPDKGTLVVGKLVASAPRTPCAVTFVLSRGSVAVPIGGAFGGLFGVVDLRRARVALTARRVLTITLPSGYQPTSRTVHARLGRDDWSIFYSVASD